MVIAVEKEMNELAGPLVNLVKVLRKQGKTSSKPFRLCCWVQDNTAGIDVDGLNMFVTPLPKRKHKFHKERRSMNFYSEDFEIGDGSAWATHRDYDNLENLKEKNMKVKTDRIGVELPQIMQFGADGISFPIRVEMNNSITCNIPQKPKVKLYMCDIDNNGNASLKTIEAVDDTLC